MNSNLRIGFVALAALGFSSSALAGVCTVDGDLGTATGAAVISGNTSTSAANNYGTGGLIGTQTCTGAAALDLQYLWTAPATADYQFDLIGSTYDTVISLRSELDCGITSLACNDDFSGLQSGVTYSATAGEQLIIVVDGFGTATGDFVLNINEFCADADGDTICDNVDLCFGDNATGDTDFDGVCDDNDLCLGDDALGDADADGVCDDGINDVCFGDDATGDSDADGTCDDLDLCFGDDASGDFDNDGICNDSDLTCDIVTTDLGSALGPFVATGTTVGAGADYTPADPSLNCGFTFSGAAEDVEFSWTAPFTGQFAFVLPNPAGITYDTVIWALDGNCNQLACNDDYPGSLRSSIVMDLTAGQTITLIVDGYNAAAGDFSLAILPTSNAGLTIDTPVAAGADVQWTVIGARPGADYRLYFSRPGAAAGNPTPFPGGPSSTLDFPKGVAQGVVEPEGTFEVTATAPANLPAGLPFTFQAVYWDGAAGGVTNVAGTISQ